MRYLASDNAATFYSALQKMNIPSHQDHLLEEPECQYLKDAGVGREIMASQAETHTEGTRAHHDEQVVYQQPSSLFRPL